jgi:Putative transmembrane protein (PGPGW)
MNRWLQKWVTRFGLDALPALRRFLIGAIGFSVVLIGLVMVFLPGPAFIVVPLGVAILASEFAWARRVWRRGRILISRVRGKPIARERSKSRDQAALAPGAPLI